MRGGEAGNVWVGGGEEAEMGGDSAMTGEVEAGTGELVGEG